jgi:predicted DNA-binding transcriptional regulator AlpA
MVSTDHLRPTLNTTHRNHPNTFGALPAALQDSALIDIKMVGALLGLKSPNSVRARIGGVGGLPQPIHLSRRCARWRVSDVRAYIEAQAAKRDPA